MLYKIKPHSRTLNVRLRMPSTISNNQKARKMVSFVGNTLKSIKRRIPLNQRT